MDDADRPADGEGDTMGAGDLVTQLLGQLTRLFRSELDLARAELDQTLHRLGVGLALCAAALVITLAALNALTGALIAALVASGLGPTAASLLAGAALAVIALLVALRARAVLRRCSLSPTRTLNNIRKDGLTLKEAI